MIFSYPDNLLNKWVAIDAGEAGGTLAHVFGIHKETARGANQSVTKIIIATDILVVSTFGDVQVIRKQRSIALDGRYPYKIYDNIEDMKDDIFIDSLKLNRESTVMLAKHVPELRDLIRDEA